MTLRSPIISVLGHVDHGKTSMLHRIRGTSITKIEAGLITQHVGASFVPTDFVKKKTSVLLKKYGFDLKIPGLLFIDTPGHEAFVNLRKRGGSTADLAILVVDVAQGFQPQTIESIKILKTYKTPFVVAVNKIDLIHGWISKPEASFADSFAGQRDFVQNALDERLYEIMRQLGEMGIDSERFDRVNSMTKQVLLIPVSAKTGEGFSELLVLLSGLAQKFMEKKLDVNVDKPARGTVLEVKPVEGLGVTIDCIIYEGCIKAGDEIVVATRDGPIAVKTRALMVPAPLEEIRDPRKKFKAINSVFAASGVKISGHGLEHVISGSPLMVAGKGDVEKLKKEVAQELSGLMFDKQHAGVIVKADALGSLEALVFLFSKAGVPIKKADVGVVNKKDILEAEAVKNQDSTKAAVFAFNLKTSGEVREDAKKAGVPLFESDVIYHLQEEYEKWRALEVERVKLDKIEKYIYPAKIRVLEGFVFRASRPAVVGVEVLGGVLKPKTQLMNEQGKLVGRVEGIQESGKTVDRAAKGVKVAVSIDGATVGRNLHEKDVLFTAVPLEQLRELERGFDDKKVLEELRSIQKKKLASV